MTVTLQVNGEVRTASAGTSLRQLLVDCGFGQAGPCVVAVNEEHVPGSLLDLREVHADDRVEILTVRQGG